MKHNVISLYKIKTDLNTCRCIAWKKVTQPGPGSEITSTDFQCVVCTARYTLIFQREY